MASRGNLWLFRCVLVMWVVLLGDGAPGKDNDPLGGVWESVKDSYWFIVDAELLGRNFTVVSVAEG